jgi:hypothetical protein
VGPSLAGVAATASRSDHAHPWQTLAAISILQALASVSFTEGTLVHVTTLGAIWQLRQSALTVDNITVVTALGKAGFQWIRIDTQNLVWAARTAWFVDPQNSSGTASDEGTGADITHPLRSYSELARRLFNADLRQNVAVTVMSSRVTTDLPIFSCTPAAGFVLTFSGTLTALYSGTITTFTAGAAAPVADDGDTMADTGIPVSFTASGMLANAILFKRTNSTAAYWWAAKDLGTKTLRISRPTNAATTAAVVLATNDTYTAYTMPTIGAIRFTRLQSSLAVVVQFCEDVASTSGTGPVVALMKYMHCWHSASNFFTGAMFGNPAFSGSSKTIRGLAPATTTQFAFGLVKATLTLVNRGFQWSGRVTIQGGKINSNGDGFLTFVDDVAIYDTTGVALIADYWSFILFQNGALAGKTNSGATVVHANKWSQIAFLVASLSVAGTFTNATPYAVGATAFTPAAIDAGTANQLATKGNGIYPTD